MKGSFVRKSAAGAADVGTRPGLHGQTLLSTGLADWDKLLGGGLPLGTICLLLEDPHSQQHLNFIRYFLGEAVMTGQQVAWFAPRQPTDGVAAFLPGWVNPETSSSSTCSTSTSAAGADAEDEGLRIAWQYRKYIQAAQQQRQVEEQQQAGGKPSSVTSSGSSSSSKAASAATPSRTAAQKAVDAGVSRQWCHTYDLSRSMDTERVSKHGLVCQALNSSTDFRQLPQVANQAVQFIQGFTSTTPISSTGHHPIPSRGPQPVGRVVIQSVLSPAWSTPTLPGGMQSDNTHSSSGTGDGTGELPGAGSGDGAQAAARLLYALRQAVQDSRCAVLVTLQADMLKASSLVQLQHMCHTVITLGSISDASDVYKLLPDPTSAAALLSIQRLAAVGMLSPRITDSQLYVVRHKRKKLAITPVDVDPDAQTKQQEATTAAVAALGKLGVVAGVTGKTGGSAGRPSATTSQAAKGLDF